MSDNKVSPQAPMQDLLSKLSRYEALFELTGVINAAEDIESVGGAVARRLKYVSDVYCWRYMCIDGDPDDVEAPDLLTIVVDGFRGHVILNPTDETLRLYRVRRERFEQLLQETQQIVDLPAETIDHRRIVLRANLEFKSELSHLEKYGAEFLDSIALYGMQQSR